MVLSYLCLCAPMVHKVGDDSNLLLATWQEVDQAAAALLTRGFGMPVPWALEELDGQKDGLTCIAHKDGY